MTIQRRGWDSNPRGTRRPLTVFETAPFNHSGTPPYDGLLLVEHLSLGAEG
jgi:hypothetical protein